MDETSSGADSIITTVNPQTGKRSAPLMVRGRLSCFAFSQATKVLVCNLETCGLVLVNVFHRRRMSFDLPVTITHRRTRPP
jgi:hypothetical protein